MRGRDARVDAARRRASRGASSGTRTARRRSMWGPVPLPGAAFLVGLVVTGLVLAACGGGGGAGSAGSAGGAAGSASAAGATGGSHATTSTAPPTTTTTTVPPEPGWNVLATEKTGVAIDGRTVSEPDGTTVTLVRFRPNQVHFDLHDGATDPPSNGATLGPNGGDAVSQYERPILLAAFNGGFKVTTGAGGMEVNGQVLTPLVPGMASLVVNNGAAASIGVWGQGFPPAGEQVVGVRQNLPPLVVGGQPAANVGDVAAWGATIGGTFVARSALGETATGALVYAGSMSTVPSDLASALVGVGVQTAMELDINPTWVQADVAATPGATLGAAVPGQNRPADQYLAGWTRDFVAVLAGPPGVPAGA